MITNKMTYEIAEYKYIIHMREVHGLIGEIDYPSEKHSQKDSEGNWLLMDYNSSKMAKVLTSGKIIA